MYESITAEATRLLVMDRDPLSAAELHDVLEEQGWSCTVVNSVAGVLKSIRSCTPPAIVVRAALDHPDFGCDHIVRVLKQTYPRLPVVITATELDRRVAAIRDEFGVPYLIEPFGAAELFAALGAARHDPSAGLDGVASHRAIGKSARKAVPG